MMEHPSLDSMMELQRFPQDLRSLMLLLLYTPIGLCLLLLRLFVGAHVFLVSCVLPDSVIKRFLMRVMTSVLGVFTSESESHVRDKTVKICVSNHRTYFDHNVVGLITPCTSPSLSCSPGFLCWARGFLELGAPGSRVQLQESLKHYLSQSGSLPLLLFPEEETTNGKTGLLHFSSWAFSLSDAVQPLSLLVQRPLVSPVVTGCTWVVELLWMLFVPFTIFHVRWLPPVTRHPKESDEDFASRVQKLMALSMGICGTNHTTADRAELLKRRNWEPPPPAPSISSPTDSRMVQRVKEVLPQVPLPVIYKDLARTGCVDTTITNLLEGRVPFVSEEEASGRSEASTSSNRPTKCVIRGFGRRPEDRHLSLQERKEALYEYARRRYLVKFGPLERVDEDGAKC
uniref:Lipid droplet-regulating VLDL assembly factor AUP1 n=1 Tax=Leptobrachium leishanense TaxID=445787 RepID=A0A8C5PU81_9ANUR